MLGLSYNADLHVPSDRTPVDRQFFNKRFKAIYDQLSAMDAAVSSYGAAEATLVELGLARLNETLGPLLATLQNAADLGFMLARSDGTAHSLVEDEAIGWTIAEADRELFTPTPFLLAQDDADETNWGLLSLDAGGWTKATGELATHVAYASKTQSSTTWTISANSAVIPVMAQYVADAQAARSACEAIHTEVDALWVLIQDLYEQIQEGPVVSVNGYTGDVDLATADVVGLTAALADKASVAQLAAKQNASSKLDALINLTWAANKLIYATGASGLSTLDVSEFAKTLLDDASASAALTTLGMSEFVKTLLDDATASAALSTLGVSAFAKSLLDDGDAAAARSTLGLGALATVSQAAYGNIASAVWATAAEVLAGAADKAVEADTLAAASGYVALADASPIQLDLATGVNFSVTITAARTLANPTNHKVGRTIYIAVKQDAAGGKTLAYDTQYDFGQSSAPVLSTGANVEDLLAFHVRSSSKMIYLGIRKDVG